MYLLHYNWLFITFTSLIILHKVYLKQYIHIYSNILLVLFISQLYVILSLTALKIKDLLFVKYIRLIVAVLSQIAEVCDLIIFYEVTETIEEDVYIFPNLYISFWTEYSWSIWRDCKLWNYWSTNIYPTKTARYDPVKSKACSIEWLFLKEEIDPYCTKSTIIIIDCIL